MNAVRHSIALARLLSFVQFPNEVLVRLEEDTLDRQIDNL